MNRKRHIQLGNVPPPPQEKLLLRGFALTGLLAICIGVLIMLPVSLRPVVAVVMVLAVPLLTGGVFWLLRRLRNV